MSVWRAGVLGLFFVSGAPAAWAQSFSGLGFLPGFSPMSQARGLSADGTVVVGYSNTNDGLRAFRWTAGVMAGLGVPQGDAISLGTAISGNGAVAVGYGTDASGSSYRHGFGWSGSTGMFVLTPLLPGGWSQANGVSADGSVIAGYSASPSGFRAFRWTSAAGMQDLGVLAGETLSFGYGISADGLAIVGVSYGASSGQRAFRWTAGGGMVDIGTVAARPYAIAQAVSADGSVIVGQTGFSASANSGGTIAFRWTGGGGMQDLGTVSGAAYSYALALSADGSVVVGYSGSSFNNHAFVLTPRLGMVDLNLYLPTIGVDLSGWILTSSTGVSANGLILAGYGAHNGSTEAWIATLPLECGSADFNGDGDTGTDADIEAFFACLAGSCCASCGSSDFNGDGDTGTDADIESFFRVLSGGAC